MILNQYLHLLFVQHAFSMVFSHQGFCLWMIINVHCLILESELHNDYVQCTLPSFLPFQSIRIVTCDFQFCIKQTINGTTFKVLQCANGTHPHSFKIKSSQCYFVDWFQNYSCDTQSFYQLFKKLDKCGIQSYLFYSNAI